MRDFDENNITAAVIDRYQNTPDPRLKKIMTSLVQHLHDFVRDVEPTEAEWGQAIEFLTRTGKLCTDKRQEFILLSDTLGVSMLVDAINHRFAEGTTETTVKGPFYVQNPPEAAFGADIRGEAKGDPLYIDGSILSEDGKPVANAIVDVWHSDAEGFYDVQLPELEEPTLRARFHSDSQGRFRFWTIMPRYYPIPYDGTVGDMLKATERHPYRPAHVHFMILAEGHEPLVTHLFVDGDQYLDSDAVFAVKNSLIRDFTREAPGIAPDGKKIDVPWRKLHSDFVLSKAAAKKTALRPAATLRRRPRRQWESCYGRRIRIVRPHPLRDGVRVKGPNLAILEILHQLCIRRRIHLARPHHFAVVDIGAVIHPLLVRRMQVRVMHDHQLFLRTAR